MILLVEDEADLRHLLAAHLRAAGFHVIEAEDGAAYLRLAVERQPDVIIADLGLPILDGVAATRALKADPRTASIPVIMLTARTKSADIVQGLEAGAQEYVLKPFDVMELLARVRTVFRLTKARQELARLNSRLEAAVDVKTKRLQGLYEFMRDLNRANSRDRLLDLVIRAVALIAGARRISLFLVDANRETLTCERAVGMDAALVEQLRIKALEGVTGQVFRSGKAIAAKAYDAAVAPPVGEQRDYRSDAFLSAPLVSTSLATAEGVLGVLNVTDKPDNAPFCEEEIECIRSIADAAAIALDNLTRREQMRQSVRVLLQTLGHLAEYRDEETTLHLERVTQMARLLARELRREGPYASIVTDEFLDHLVQAAPMHDIGKVGVPDEILTKPGKLTTEEFQIMKTHTDIGRRVLSRAMDPAHPNPLLSMCVDIAYSHHERFDGTGYPRRIRGENIPLSARIIALVDAYDAITSRRRYKPAKSHEEAVDIIRQEAGRHLDPVLVEAFLRCHESFSQVRAKYDDVDAGEPAQTAPVT
jgi:response regulator RpfG family c-di-GMP phosphodiesterase